jgi:hypothetical protein
MFRILKEHIYGGTQFRPKPVVLTQPEVVTVFTIWGASSDGLEDELRNARPEDGESLSTFLSRLHQQLRETYQGQVGLEALVFRKGSPTTVEWCACGQPALLLAQGDKTVLLHQSLDFNFDSGDAPFVAPLPSSLLAAEGEAPHFSSGSFQLREDLKVVLLSRSWIPAHALQSLTNEQACITALAKDAEDMPFWWGLLEPSL